MSSFIGEKDRKVIPRWRSFRTSVVDIDTNAPALTGPASSSLQSNIEDWDRQRSLWTALDLVAGAIVEGRLDLASEAIVHIRTDGRTPSAALALLAEYEKNIVMEEETDLTLEQRCREQIRSSRSRLANYPFDAVEWIELARSFTTLGLREKASRCVSAALTLAPEDVFVLRCSSRFYIQQGDAERAQWILTRAPRTLSNPWLLASEIAASSVAGRQSQLLKVASRVEKSDWNPKDLTELRAAIATVELESGSNNRGKKLLRQALIGANENSLAQVQWMDRTRLGNVIDISQSKPPHRHEAAAWRSFFEGNWEKSVGCSLLWFEDQPFSADAGIFCSYVLSDMGGQPERASEILQVSLRANPDNHILRNNLAFTYIQLGRLKDAETVLATIPTDPDNLDDATVEATFGLLAFRKGHPDEGRAFYENAIFRFQKVGALELAGRAATVLALEEVRARTSNSPTSMRRAFEMTKGKARADVRFKLKELEESVRRWLSEEESAPAVRGYDWYKT